MKTHSNNYKKEIATPGRKIRNKLTYTLNEQEVILTDDDLYSMNYSYQGAILKSVMKELEINSKYDIPLNTVLSTEFSLLVNNEWESISYGDYVVYSSEKQEDTDSYKIICYDKMLYSMKDYENIGVTYPITIRNYISALCNKIGLTFKNENDAFANYNKELEKELYLDSDGNSLGYTFRDVLDELAQATASTICINEEDNQLEIRYVDELYTSKTVTGTNITINDNQNPELLGLKLYGDTYQETYSGKNLLDISELTPIANVTNINGVITINGSFSSTSWTLTKPFTLKANTTYTLSLTNTYADAGSSTFILRNGSTNIIQVRFTDGVATYTPTQDTIINVIRMYNNGKTYDNYSFSVQLEVGSATEYEPYVGGIPSPNPDYPQNVETVTGRQDIYVCGKNVLSANIEQGGWSTTTGVKISNSGLNRSDDYIPISPNTTYIYSVNGRSYAINILEYDNNKNFIGYATGSAIPANTSFTTSSNAKYITMFRSSNVGDEKWQLEKGTQATTYAPYQGSTYELNLGKNLFDEIYPNDALTYRPIFVGNGTFTLSTNAPLNTSNNANLFLLAGKVNSGGNTSINGVYINRPITVTTTDNYVTIGYRKTYGVDPSDYNTQLEKGSSVSPYSAYKTPIELCKIGTYQDYIYKYGNDWYIHKEIGKIILNGTESNWAKSGTSYVIPRSSIVNAKLPSGTTNYYCNYFTVASSGSTVGTTRVGSTNLLFNYDTSGDYLNDFKTWLGTHNVDVYYQLATPTNTQITDSELIAQLNAIELFDGINNISTISADINGELEITYISEYETFDEDYLKNINVSFGEQYGPVNVIVLSRSAGSDNIYYPETLPENPNEIKISDNQILNGNDRDTYLPDIYDKLNGLQYYINDFESPGITYLNLCDKYRVKVGNNTYPCVMFNNEINITKGLEEKIYTERPEEAETDYTKADKTDRRINQTYLIVDKQNQQITSVVSQVDGQNTKISTLTQRVDSLESEISNISGMVITKESMLATMTFTDDASESEPITVKIHPINTNISYVYPSSSLYPSSTLYLKTRKIRFHNNTTNENFDYILPDDLLYYDEDNYDEFYLDYNSETCQITKKCKYNADGTVGLLDEPSTVPYSYPQIVLSEGKYTISILGYNEGYMSITLMAKNIYTDQFYTKSETDSKIAQTAESIDLSVNQKLSNYSTTLQMNSAIALSANSITASVSQTYATKTTTNQITANLELKVDKNDNNQVVSMLNASANEINITGNRIKIESDNFKLNANGNITATGGTIGGWAIQNDFLGTPLAEPQNTYFLSQGGKSAYMDNAGTRYWYMYFKNKFGVDTDGIVFANNIKLYSATINGTISAGSSINGSSFNGGSININNYFSVNSSGGTQISTSGGGFLTTRTSTHPYVSALNVAQGAGGIVFTTGTSQSDVGSAKTSLELVSGVMRTRNNDYYSGYYTCRTGKVSVVGRGSSGDYEYYMAIVNGLIVYVGTNIGSYSELPWLV